MLISSVCFALVNLCIKFLDYLPVHELVCFRSAISLSICLYFVRRLGLPLFGNNIPWLLGRGLFGATALTLFFFAIKGVDLASATTIQYLSPVFTVVIAMILFGEKVKSLQWFLFALAFAGVLLIRGFDSSSHKDIFIVMGVISALLSGIAYNCIIKCRKTDHPITIVMYFPLIATPVMGIWSMTDWVQPKPEHWVLLLLIGCLTQIAQVTMTKALHAAPSSKIMPVKYIGAIWAILIGYFVFDERLQLITYLGILLIVSAVLINILISSRVNYDGRNDPPQSLQN